MLENSYDYAIHIIKKHFSFIMFYYQLSINLRKLSWIGIDLQEIEKKIIIWTNIISTEKHSNKYQKVIAKTIIIVFFPFSSCLLHTYQI